MPTTPSTRTASRSKTRPVASSSDDSAGTGVARATGGRLRFCSAGKSIRRLWRVSPTAGGPTPHGSCEARLNSHRALRHLKSAPTRGGAAGLGGCCATPVETQPQTDWRARHDAVRMRAARLFHRRVIHLGDVLPIDQMVDEGLEVVRPPVAVVDVVGVLPHVAAEDQLAAVHQWVLAVGGLGDGDLAILDRQPGPTRPELRDAGLNKVFLHLGDGAEVGDDLFFEIAGKLVAAAIGFHPLPKMQVVIVLAGIVEEAGV